MLNIPDDNMAQLPQEPPTQSINAMDDDSYTSDEVEAVEATLENQEEDLQEEPTDEDQQEEAQQPSPNTTAHAPTPATTNPQPFFYTHISSSSTASLWQRHDLSGNTACVQGKPSSGKQTRAGTPQRLKLSTKTYYSNLTSLLLLSCGPGPCSSKSCRQHFPSKGGTPR